MAGNDFGACFLKQHVGGQREDLLARGHDLADGHVVEFERAVDQRFLELGQQSHAARGGSDQFELVGGMDSGPLGERNIEAAQNGGRGNLAAGGPRDEQGP